MSTKLGMSSPADVANLMAGVFFFLCVFVNVIFQVAPILRLLEGKLRLVFQDNYRT